MESSCEKRSHEFIQKSRQDNSEKNGRFSKMILLIGIEHN
jgi:hypothetical protein